jgi:hypothetical protein
MALGVIASAYPVFIFTTFVLETPFGFRKKENFVPFQTFQNANFLS